MFLKVFHLQKKHSKKCITYNSKLSLVFLSHYINVCIVACHYLRWDYRSILDFVLSASTLFKQSGDGIEIQKRSKIEAITDN